MNETTLIVGILGVGKSTLARYAVSKYDQCVVITNFSKDFQEGCFVTNEINQISTHDKVCFTSDDDIENQIAMRYAYELGERLLVIDEAHIYEDSDQLKKIIRYSRQHNLDIILLSHSFFDFARLNRHLIHNIIIMKMTDDKGRGEKFELNYLDSITDDDIQIRKLQLYEFVIIKGNIPTWLNKKDLTIKNNVLKLNMQ